MNKLKQVTSGTIGIPDYDLYRIFEKGFSGSDRLKKESTGYGLYLVKKIADKLNISILAKSKVNEYTIIELIFPQE